MNYVIIGGSIAGISAMKAIREGGPRAEITVISGEKTKAYYRPMIPFLIDGRKNENDITYPDDPLVKYNVKTVFGIAKKVDIGTKEVLLASGERVAYDKLLIATGGAPVIPDIPGMKGEGIYTLRTMDDAAKIRAAASGAKSAVVIGGGLVGIKAATALHFKGPDKSGPPMDVAVVEMLPQILSQRLDKKGSEIIRAALEREGISIMTGETVSEIIREKSKVTKVKLFSERTLKADMVVVAVGVRPNITFLKDSGIKTNRGVLVNELLQTNISDVYAAGDVVEGRELLSGKTLVSGLWTNAVEMGRIAGMNMAGGNVKYPGFLSVMNASEIAGIPFVSAGIIEPEGRQYECVEEETAEGYRKLVFRNDFLEGIVFVGDIRNAGIYTNLIKNRIPAGRKKEKLIEKKISYADFATAAPL